MKIAFKNLVCLFVLTISIAGICEGQSKTDSEIEKLRKELAAANERAVVAEENARLAQASALQSQKEAERSRELAHRFELSAIRGRYIALAKLMAIKSMELSDPEQQGLVAQMAYKFNFSHGGSPSDYDVYNGLLFALTRLKDPSAKLEKVSHISNNEASSLSDSLCKQLKRNMTKEEWEFYVGTDLPYENACESLPSQSKP